MTKQGPWLIRVDGKKYVTRSQFRAFGGNIVLSEDPQRARLFTKEVHALDRAHVMRWRAKQYECDNHLKGADIQVVLFADVFTVNQGDQ